MALSPEAIQQCLIRVEQLGPYRNVDDRLRGCHCHAPSAFPGDRTRLSSAIAKSFWHTKWYKVGQNRLSEVQSQPDIPRSATPYLSTQHFHLHQDLRQLRHLRHQLLTPASQLGALRNVEVAGVGGETVEKRSGVGSHCAIAFLG